MNNAKFVAKAFEEKFEYHLPVPITRYLRHSIFDGYFTLNEPTLNTFFKENGVSAFASRENSLLYYSILKELAKNNTCYLIYFDSADAIQQLQPVLKTQKCEWRYSIEYVEGNEFCTQFGFQNPVEFLTAVNYSDKDLTNRYFYIAEIDQRSLINYVHLYGNDVTNWSFIFCTPENRETVVQLLTDAAQRPSLADMLTLVTSLVNIQIGGDEGYLDYMLIQSKNNINMVELENKLNTCAVQYETLLSEVHPIDDQWKVEFYKERFDEIFNG